MKRFSGPVLLALLLWGATTFGLAVLAAEWRQDETDLSPLSEDISGLRNDVRDLQGSTGELAAVQTQVAGLQHSDDSLTDSVGDLQTSSTQLHDDLARVMRVLGLEAATPSPTPEPVEARMANGAVVEWQGWRLTVDGYRLGSSAMGPPWADFTLENVDAPPDVTWLFQSVKVVDADGFVCSSQTTGSFGGFAPLGPGEKLTFGVGWQCRNRIVRSMTLGGGGVVLEFPQP